MLTESAGRLRQEKLQLLERLKNLETKMDDRQPEVRRLRIADVMVMGTSSLLPTWY